ncbi:MAG: DUF2142 domain-containing protein, partial [Actinobacteria bacterium]|nr:DUF2142 domain-containing protein [Actinomycetota bacterium]
MHPAERRGAPLRWARWFTALASILGLAAVFITPATWGIDEAAHVARVSLIERGFVVPPTGKVPPADYRTDGCFEAYLSANWREPYARDPGSLRDQFRNPPCARPSGAVGVLARNADIYSPVPYAPAIIGFGVGRAIGGASGSLYGARIVQLAAYIALMAFAISKIPWGKPLIFTIGLLPVSIQGAAAVSADPITLALACCAVAWTLWCTEASRHGPVASRDLVVLGVLIALLALCKSAYLPFALLVVAIPSAAFPSLRRRLVTILGMGSVAAALGGAWNVGVVNHVQITGLNNADSTAAGAWIRRHPTGFLHAVYRGWRDPSERNLVLAGMVTAVRRFNHNFPVAPWAGAAWLALVRIADPIPAVLWRPINAAARRRAGVGSAGAQPGDPAPGPSSDPEAVPGSDDDATGVAAIPVVDRVIAVAVAVSIAGIAFVLIEYGLAISANPPGMHEIVWVQGRYLLPLVPLTLFGVSGNAPRLDKRLLGVIPV